MMEAKLLQMEKSNSATGSGSFSSAAQAMHPSLPHKPPPSTQTSAPNPDRMSKPRSIALPSFPLAPPPRPSPELEHVPSLHTKRQNHSSKPGLSGVKIIKAKEKKVATDTPLPVSGK